MKKIELSQDMIALVDNEDYPKLIKFKWYAHKVGNTYYATRSQMINKVTYNFSMHRIIMNTPPGINIDHKDHNGLNNQKSNLRNCTTSQNCKNRTGSGFSKYLGVALAYPFYHKRLKSGYVKTRRISQRYEARIKYEGKNHRIGLFKTEEEAAKAYDREARLHHGEFANLNFNDDSATLDRVV